MFDTLCECTGGPSSLAIGRNLIATDPAAVSVDSGTIDGNADVVGATGEVWLTNLSVGGNLRVEGTTSTATVVSIRFDRVGGQVLDLNNQLAVGPGFGFNLVGSDTIGGNLLCQGNTPAPIDQDGPNTVLGKEQGQCEGL